MTADNPATRRPRAVVLVLGATVIAAASSFLVLLIVAPALGPAQYATFSIYWSALFMVVGVLFGVQQEGTRAVAAQLDTREHGPTASLLKFSAVVGIGLLVTIAVSGIFWAESLFGAGNSAWVFPLGIAVAAYALVAAVNGVLAGSNKWGLFALLPVIDGLVRLILVLVVLWADWGMNALVWAIAIPFPLSLAVVWVLGRTQLIATSRISNTYRGLTLNTGRTMLASASTAVLVNGFPVVLAIFGRSDEATLGAIVLALMLTRAPILVPLTALQSMLIARFSADSRMRTRFLLVVVVGLASVTVLLSLLVLLVGEFLLGVVFGEGFALAGPLLAGLVAAAGCLGILTATGAAVLAAERHNAFALGWILASVIAILVIALMPGELGLRTVLALVIGPLVGAVVHVAVFLATKPAKSGEALEGTV